MKKLAFGFIAILLSATAHAGATFSPALYASDYSPETGRAWLRTTSQGLVTITTDQNKCSGNACNLMEIEDDFDQKPFRLMKVEATNSATVYRAVALVPTDLDKTTDVSVAMTSATVTLTIKVSGETPRVYILAPL